MKRLLLLLFLLLTARTLSADLVGYCNNPVTPCFSDDPNSPCYVPPEPDPKCEPCDKCTLSPCYAATGVYVTDVTDLELDTTGFPITAGRQYQSNRAIDGEVGYGWVSSFSAHLTYTAYLLAAPSTVQREVDVRMTDGALYRFTENTDGTYAPPKGRFDVLVRNGDGSFDLKLQRTRSHMLFDASGKLVSTSDDYGNTIAYTYSGDHLQHVADTAGSGRSLDIAWGADGRISDVTDMTGRAVHYAYDGRGVLTGVTNVLGQTTVYSYVAGRWVPLLSAVTDPWGRNVTTITYDPQTRTHSYTENGETWTYTYAYNNNTSVTAKTDSAGNMWKFTYITGGLVTDRLAPGATVASHVTYDANGLPVTKIDEVGKKTTYAYNGDGSVTSVILDDGGPNTVEYRYVYDAQFPERLASVTPYRPGTNQVDPKWPGWRNEYYAPGSPAPGALYRELRLNGDGTTTVMATYVRDAHGQITNRIDAAGGPTDYGFDAAGNLTSVTLPANNDGGVRPVYSYTVDTLGRTTSVTDPLGHATTYSYDAANRITSVTLPKPAAGSPLVFTTICAYDQLDSAFPGLLFDRITDANGVATRHGFDAFGELAAVVDGAGNATRYGWSKGFPVSFNDANGNITTFSFDALGRMTAINYPDGQHETYAFNADGTMYRKTDRKGQSVTFTYDGLKRVTSKAYAGVGSINFIYDGLKIIQVNDTTTSPGEVHTFTYDAAFLATSQAQAGRGTLTYTHDAAGRLASVSAAGGSSRTYSYYPDSSPRTIQWSVLPGEFKYTYRLNQQVDNIAFPNGQTRLFSYDDQSRVVQIDNVHPTAGHLATFSYGYDLDNATGLPTLLGQRVRATATIPSQGLAGADTRLYYDTLYRLTRADYPSSGALNGETDTWTYDAIGNRVTATAGSATRTYSYQTAGTNTNAWQRLANDGTSSYTYDANGNTTAQTGFTFTWDYDNRLTGVSGAAAAAYHYDYAGRRTSRVSGSTTEFLYDGPNVLSQTGPDAADYLFGIGIDKPLAMSRGGVVSFFDVDALGSVVAVNASDGTVQNNYQYDAWGVAALATETVQQPFRFTAREAGDVPGQLLFRARFLAPATGRFLSEDPLGVSAPESDPAGLWSYAYSENNPVAFVDPFGLKACSCEPLTKLVHANNKCAELGDNTVICIIMKEVSGDPTRRHSKSKKGARGYMQIEPGTAKDFHCKNVLTSNAANIACGSKYLCWIYRNWGLNDITMSLALYTSGPYAGMNGPDSTEPDWDYATKVLKCKDCMEKGGNCLSCNPNPH